MPNWKKVIVSGSDAELNSLNVTSELTASGLIYPTTDGTDGQTLVTDGAGNLTFGFPTNADDAEKVTFAVQNDFTSTLQKGTPIHITSTTNGTSLVVPASASDASTMPAHGILNSQLAVGVDGEATIIGQITGVDTSAFSSGDTVYVGASGGYTNVKPQGSGNLIQNLGVVKKVDASNGTGEIFGSGRSNDVPNLPVGKVWVGSSTYSVTSSVAHLDEINERLGINTNTPGASLDVIGDILGSTTLTIGSNHTNTGISSSIAGGVNNCLTGNCSTIAGGTLNTASLACSFIGGGCNNSISGTYSSTSNIVGGRDNTISATYSSYSSIVGGRLNKICGVGPPHGCNFIGGGYVNTVSGYYSSILGGSGNTISGYTNTIAGGSNNSVPGCSGFIGAGFNNTLYSEEASIIGAGGYNEICQSNSYSIIGAGRCNTISGYGECHGIVAGFCNTISDTYTGGGCETESFIGSGRCNTISTYTGGGESSYIQGKNVIVGGEKNALKRINSTDRIGWSFIGGGCLNTGSAAFSFIGGGFNNYISSSAVSSSGILGGENNEVTHAKSFIIGSDLSSTAVCYTFMNNACVAGTTRTTTLVETSAKKYKECILPLQDQIENIKKLEPVEFQWKKDKTKDIGFIAEEVEKVFPNLVSYEENGEINGIQYSKLTTVLVKALQQQQEQIDELKKEIFILKQQG